MSAGSRPRDYQRARVLKSSFASGNDALTAEEGRAWAEAAFQKAWSGEDPEDPREEGHLQVREVAGKTASGWATRIVGSRRSEQGFGPREIPATDPRLGTLEAAARAAIEDHRMDRKHAGAPEIEVDGEAFEAHDVLPRRWILHIDLPAAGTALRDTSWALAEALHDVRRVRGGTMGRVADHGGEFASSWRDLVEIGVSGEAARELEDSFRANRVRFDESDLDYYRERLEARAEGVAKAPQLEGAERSRVLAGLEAEARRRAEASLAETGLERQVRADGSVHWTRTDDDVSAMPDRGAQVARIEDAPPSPKDPSLPGELEFRACDDLSRNPAAIYLARLAPSGRRTMATSLDRIAHALAGRKLEKEEVLAPEDRDLWEAVPWQDLRYAHTQALRAWMVGRWGMSEEVGPVDVRDSEDHPFLGREIAQPRRFSEETAQAADKAVRRLLTDAEQRATEVLEAHRARIGRLIATLEEQETLDRAAVAACLGPTEVPKRAGHKPEAKPGSSEVKN